MRRLLRCNRKGGAMPRSILVTVVALAAVAGSAGFASANRSPLDATSRPCGISSDGVTISALRPGRYTIVVHDFSRTRFFRLNGPGVARSTTARFDGSTKWAVRFVRGTYRFSCARGSDRTLRVR